MGREEKEREVGAVPIGGAAGWAEGGGTWGWGAPGWLGADWGRGGLGGCRRVSGRGGKGRPGLGLGVHRRCPLLEAARRSPVTKKT
ncbi:hypothetical protein TIFTF001_007567 [Ficus carica]|uniref:Uncharacterized protein n=1 Tax=Ficus carica TaxID=3494 RepID=A0AA88A374_FICCA|nr:hypothetical protein TIFTF001_007567 [Ficus carica]